MSAIKLGKFQSQEFGGWAHMTKDNHLSNLGLLTPQQMSDRMVQLYAYQTGGNMFSLLNSLPKKEFDNDMEYTWNVIGTSRRNIALVKAETFSGETVGTDGNVGTGMEPFYLYFAENWFAKGEVIFGNLNELYPIRITSDAEFFGTYARYKCELMGGLVGGIPGERLQAGERFSIGFAPVSRELSREVGSLRFATPVAMRNEWTTIRLKYKVPGNKMDRKIAFGMPIVKEVNGKASEFVENRWMSVVEWTFEQQWQEYKNMAMQWGSSNRTENGEYLNFDPSGEVIRMGDGLSMQLRRGNVIYYNKFSLKLIEDAIYEITSGRGFNKKEVILNTGAKGAEQFSKAVQEIASGWTMFNLNGDALGVVKKTASPLHQNSLSAGYQFTEYQAPNGLVVKVHVDPFLDDPIHNKVAHPDGGPASSYKYEIMDLSDANDGPNIFLCGIKGQSETRSIVPGIRDPYTGSTSVNFASSDEDASTLHRMTTFGVCVQDPTRTLSIIPNILA